jgi:hypothetical protein
MAKNLEGFSLLLLLLLTFIFCNNQIWLNNLMDDCNFSYGTKLKKKLKNKKNLML